jgi:gamma-glutamyltranspeptidase/glutathione hydrolase
MPLAELLAPAIKLAKSHTVSPRAALSLKAQWDKLKADPSARAIYGKKGGKGPAEAGDRIVQRELAQTLAEIASHGDAGFYDGRIAELFEQSMKKNGGDVTKADLAAYRAKLRKPLSIKYRGFTVETMPPPSMGGIAVLETLRGLELTRAFEAPVDSPKAVHAFVESAKRAYADRRLVGADPDFYGADVPQGAVDRLLSWGHVASYQPPFDPEHATPAAAIAPDAAAAWAKKESPETTHLSVVDGDGNAVSCTVTLSASFGAKVIVPGTGIVLSNAIGAFSPSGSNAPAPGKRMASSMSPTILSRDGKVTLVVGSPGGDTIPNTVSQVIRNLVDYGMDVDAAALHGRVHHQLVPDEIRTERGREPPDATKQALTKLGHTLAPSPVPIGDAKIILIAPGSGEAFGVSDAREGGLALAAKAPKKADAKRAK